LKQETGRVDTVKIRCQHVVPTAASVLDQDFGQADDGRNRRSEFLTHESGEGTFKALVRLGHVAS
jgi:hypothetical protein